MLNHIAVGIEGIPSPFIGSLILASFTVELILFVFVCRFETFNMSCPLFFPRHHKHEIKNQTRQHHPTFNRLSHSKPPYLILSLLSLSFSLVHLHPMQTHKQPPSEPTTTTECPTIHNPYKLQATTPPKSDQTHNPKAKQNKTHKMKPTKWRNPIGILNSGCCWVFI
ncbi:hypothetical protein ACJW30_10G115700 [Castanea mollissima]